VNKEIIELYRMKWDSPILIGATWQKLFLEKFESPRFTIRRILQLVNDKGPIGELL
jgi:hypothetical protein